MYEQRVAAAKQADGRVEDLDLRDGRITGLRVGVEDAGDAPLVVFLHGGGSSAGEAVKPGASILGTLADAGSPGFALNRPGYHGSHWLEVPPTADDVLYRRTAEVLDDALAELWRRFGGASRGIVLAGSSVGGAIAIDLAARWGREAARGGAQWPLIGLAATDVGFVPTPASIACWNETAVEEFVGTVTATAARHLDFGPRWCRYGSPIEGGKQLTIPRAEMIEIVGGWPRRAPQQAAAVTVPVRFRVGEFDPLWQTDDARIDEIRSAFASSAPSVDAGRADGAGRPISGGPLGRTHLLQTVAFVEFCRVSAEIPQILHRARR